MKSRARKLGNSETNWPRHPHGRSGAFTLIELLTVIAIIAVLAAMLLPVINNAKITALQAKSVGNLRSIGLAFRLFANDHDGKIPQCGFPAIITVGTDAGYASSPRALFPTDSPLGGHPLGGGDYAKSVAIFYSPLLTKLAGKIPANAYYIDPADNRPKIGYFFCSFTREATAQTPPRLPVMYKGQLISNSSVLDWGRSPVYFDYISPSAENYGLIGNNLLVLHLDASVSVRSRKVGAKVLKTLAAAFYYYLATGEEN